MSENGPSINESIKDQILKKERSGNIIRDLSLLDPNKIVDEDRIVGRDQQLEDITDNLAEVVSGNQPSHMLLYGPSGTGKSLIANAVSRNVEEICKSRGIDFASIEVNCQDTETLGPTVHRMVLRIAEKAGVETDIPEHGIPNSRKWREFYKISNDNFDSLVIILDELDMLTGRRDMEEPGFSRLLYQLTRSASDVGDVDICVAAITNDAKMMDNVGSRAQSSYSPQNLHFPDYDANQICDILYHREDAFVEDALADGTIPLTAGLAAKTHGDARAAIDLLRTAGKKAAKSGEKQVTEEHVRAAQQKVDESRVIEVIRGLSMQKKFCLLAAAAVATETIDNDARTVEAHPVYKYIVEQLDSDIHKRETLINKLKELSTYSLVDFDQVSYGRGGIHMVYTFSEPPEIVARTVIEDSRFENITLNEIQSVARAHIDR